MMEPLWRWTIERRIARFWRKTILRWKDCPQCNGHGSLFAMAGGPWEKSPLKPEKVGPRKWVDTPFEWQRSTPCSHCQGHGVTRGGK